MRQETGTWLDQVVADLDATASERIEELAQYVAVSSVSASQRGVGEATEYLLSRAASWGFEASLLENDLHPAVVLRAPGPPGSLKLLVYGHYDVQPAGPVELWDSDPFVMDERDGRLFGRGTADNKGQHLAHIHALSAWILRFGQAPIDVTVLLDGEEEIGSPNLARIIDRHRETLDCDLVLWSDGPVHESGAQSLNFGVRGIAGFELVARGAGIDLHSGNWGGVAPQPAWSLVHLLNTMRGPNGEFLIRGLEDEVDPLSKSEQAALDALPVDNLELKSVGISVLDEPVSRPFYDRLAAYPTLTINSIDTGSDGRPRTVIPCEARASCDIRLVDSMTAAGTFELVRAHVAEHAPSIECIMTHQMEPSRVSLDLPYVQALRQAVVRIQGGEPLLVPAMGGSLPDYVFTKILGRPSIGLPFANPDEANHGPNENIERWRYLRAANLAAAAYAHLATIPAETFR